MAIATELDFNAMFADLAARIHFTNPSTPPTPPATETVEAKAGEVEVNVELFRTALEGITDHPETHHQNVWARRNETGDIIGCLAYHVTRLTGHTVRWSNSPWTGLPRYESGYVIPDNSTDAVPMYEAARMALGLTHTQANHLFHPLNETDDLWAMAENFTNGQITRKEKVNA
jgi:hypothetical protein